MKRSTNNLPVVADFFAQGYRVSGTFAPGIRSLPDVIYDMNTSFILVQDAYLSPITTPAKISAYYATTLLAKSSLDFLVTLEQRDGLRRDQRYALAKNVFSLTLTVPFFEIRGDLYTVNRSFDPRVFLSNDAGDFITLVNVTARCTFNSEVTYQGGAALISRQSIGFLGERKPLQEQA